MKKLYYMFLWVALILCACGNEDELTPSYYDINWLVVEDNPNDPIDHQRYLIFKETGIPVYYNDTIGSMERLSAGGGDPYTYYEILQVFYVPGNKTPITSTARYSLIQNREKVKPVLDFLQDEIIPVLPKGLYIPSIFLVDTLVTPMGDSLAYKGFNTVVLAQVPRFELLDDDGKNSYKSAFLASLVSGSLLKEEEWLEEEFYQLTYNVNPGYEKFMYSSTLNYAVYKACTGMEEQTLSVLGFLEPKSVPYPGAPERSWYVPTKTQDVQSYCKAVFAHTEAEFKALHGDAPVVMAKYYVIRGRLSMYGFEFH